MFGCTLEAPSVSDRDAITALQTELEHYYHNPLVIRLLTVERFADGSLRSLVRYTRGGSQVVEHVYGFHYCEHEGRVIVDLT